MKICNLSLCLNKGGAENVISILSNKWSEKNEVSIILLINKNKWPIQYKLKKKIKIYDLDLYSKSKNIFIAFVSNFKRVLKIRRIIKKINPDVLISHCSREITLSYFATLFLDVRIIGYIHSHPKLVKETSYFWRLLTYIAFSLINSCIIFSVSNKKYLPFLAKKKSKIIFNVSNENKKILVQNNYNNKNIIIIGSFIDVKNHICAIKVFKTLNQEFKDWSMTILGDGPLRKSYHKIIKQLDLQSKIYLPGVTNNIYQYIEKSSIFLLPSKSEGLSLSLIESIKSGLPVVISNCSEAQNELVKKNKCGIVYKKNNKQDLLNTLRYLMQNVNLRKKFGKNSINLSKKISNDEIFKNWDKLLKKTNDS